jgi:predicted permease
MFADETLSEQKPLFEGADVPGIDLVPAQEGLEGGRARTLRPLYLIMMAVALVLMIACSNIAGLLLARATARNREIALRLALGARRVRLITQLLVESLLLSGTGGLFALLVAHWSAPALLLVTDRDGSGPAPFEPQLDWRVLAFTATIAVLTGLILGLVPALRSLRVDVIPALKAGPGAADAAAARTRWYSMGNALVVMQLSLAIVTLVTAGLLVRTLRNLRSVGLGFDSNNVLVFGLNPALAGYKGSQVDAMFLDLQEQLAALPGARSVTYSWAPLLRGWRLRAGFHAPGTPPKQASNPDFMPVGPRFFQSIGIPLKAGRDFSAADFAAAASASARPADAKPDPSAAPTAVIVNEAFVRRFFPHSNPIGQHLERALPDDPTEPRGPGWEVIGIAGDARYDSLRNEINPTMYAANSGSAFFSVRTHGDPLAMVPVIRNLINRKNSDLAMYGIATEEQQIERQVFTERLVARLSSFFGLLALILACAGIYGLLSYEVAQRTREIGIRMAIGAQQGDVVRMVVRQGLLVAVIGAVIGSAASFGAKGLLASILYKVQPGDPATLVVVAVILLVVALAACYLPARRATRVDPLVALRYE